MTFDIKKITRRISKAYYSYGTLVFFVIISIGLSLAILALVSIVASSNEPSDETNELISDKFDTKTIERIRTLRSDRLTEPGKRPSPFEE